MQIATTKVCINPQAPIKAIGYAQQTQPMERIRDFLYGRILLLRQEEAQLVGGDQLDFFGNYAAHQQQKAELERELSGQQAIVALRQKYGKNAVLRGMDLQEGATTKNRNGQIGGHKA